MKKILIATDLSPAARNATDYALRLAEALQARVVLMSAYEQTPVMMPDALVALNIEEEQNLVQRQLQEEVDNLMIEKPEAIEIMTREGSATTAILKAAQDVGADLIVVGFTSEEKGSRKFFGSTATGLARKTLVPLLVVPEKAHYRKPAGIALAEDVLLEKDQPTPAEVIALLEKFHARFFLIRIFNQEKGELVEVLHQSANLRRKIGALTPLPATPLDNKIATTLETAIETEPIDILVMRPEPKTLIRRWLEGSTTRDMIFETSVPLLILPATLHD